MNALRIWLLSCVLCLCLGACTSALPGDSQIGTAVSGTLAASVPNESATPTTAVAQDSAIPMPVPSMAAMIDTYLAGNVGSAYLGGRVFCAYDLMDYVQDARQQQTTLYLWVLCQEYLAVGDILELGTGVSVPVVLFVNQTEDGWKIAHRLPGDGTQYGQDVRILFPQHLWPEIWAEDPQAIERYNQRAETLERLTEQAARIHYLFGEFLK